MVMPQFAAKVGLNESIVLQQIHYWLVQHEKQQIDYYDGKYWVYNSYPQWQKQFPFWSARTINSIFLKLESLNLITSDNFNKLTLDRTKWYTINYQELNKYS